jgi:hypothetical protein
VIEEEVAPVDQTNPVPVAVSTELPHPSTAETVGATGAPGPVSDAFKVADGQPFEKSIEYIPPAIPEIV